MELYFKKIIYLIILATFLQVSCMSEDEELSSSLKNDQAGGSPDEAYQDIYPPKGNLSLNTECGMQLDLSATDDVGVTGYYISNNSNALGSGKISWVNVSSSKTFSTSVFANSYIGKSTGNLFIWYKDDVGNVSSSSSVYVTQITQDNASPQGSVIINNPINVSSEIIVNLSATDKKCGVTGYFISENSTLPSSTDSNWIEVSISENYSNDILYKFDNLTALNKLNVWYKDNSRNISNVSKAYYELGILIDNNSSYTNSKNISISLGKYDNSSVVGYYLSDNSTTPSENTSGWVNVDQKTEFISAVTKDVGSEDGIKNFYVWYKNSNGEISSKFEDSIIYDQTAPLGNITINSNDAITKNRIVTLNISSSDAFGVSAYYISETSNNPEINASGWVNLSAGSDYTDNISFTLSAGTSSPTTKTIYIWFKDHANNISNSISDSITLDAADTSAPTGSVDYSSSCGGTLTLTATDNIGVSGYYISNSSQMPMATDSGWIGVNETTNLSKNISAYSYSTYTNYYLWYKDSSGNLSTRTNIYISSKNTDYSNPSISSLYVSDNGNYSENVIVSITATDNCGINAYYLSTDSSPPSSPSSSSWISVDQTKNLSIEVEFNFNSVSSDNYVYAWVKDTSNRKSSYLSSIYRVPIMINSGADYTNLTSVSISLAKDDSSYITGYYLSESSSAPPISSSGWLTVSNTTSFNKTISHSFSNSPGTKTIYAWFRNALGVVSSSYSDSIIYETTAPTGSLIINSADNTTKNYLVNMKLTASDQYGVTGYYLSETNSKPSYNSSGWNPITSSKNFSDNVSFSLNVGNGIKTVYAWFKDDANNVSDNISDNITLNFPGEISAGSEHTCGLYPNGNAKCWGKGENYQLGDGSTSNRSSPISVSNLSDAVQLAPGGTHTCALLQNGTVKCWGNGTYGQLGDGNDYSNTSPNSVSSFSEGISIDSGTNHSCAVTQNGVVACWGYNAYGQIGDGTITNKSSPFFLPNLSGVKKVALGGLHSCALLFSGVVKCWGYGGNGQLGNGGTSNSSAPVSVTGITDAVDLIAGSSHTCARLAGGKVKCWGYGGNGQLGNGYSYSQSNPVSVLNLTSIIDIGAGDQHSCAIDSNGSVSCWGGNIYGQLGDNTTNSSSSAVKVKNLINAEQISLGDFHSCVLDQYGASYCWGRNSYGQLGDASTTDKYTIATTGFKTDSTAPIGSVTIDNSTTYTSSSTSLNLNLSATDSYAVTSYCVMDNQTTPNNSDSCWKEITATSSYKSTVSHPIDNGTGFKVIYVYYKDGANNISSPFSDSINCSIAGDNCSSSDVTPGTVWTFSNAGATGRTGPTQSQIKSAYYGTNLYGKVTINTQGIQEWIVPVNGIYTIEAWGAEGSYGDGGSGGKGARMRGDFELSKGGLNIIVGQKGVYGGSSEPGGGGGGSFVYTGDIGGSGLLIAAAGGGGAGEEGTGNGQPGVLDEHGTCYDGSLCGTPGEGGTFGGDGGSGAGWNSNGNGGVRAGTRWNGGDSGADGGFGGGGAGKHSDGGGCGGGYSGGSSPSYKSGGGGGGSYNSGSNQNNTSGNSIGHGKVVITLN